VTAGHAIAAARWRSLGLRPERILPVSPGVAMELPGDGERTLLRRSLGLPPSARLVVGIGPLEAHKGFHDAIWAFDILHFLYHDLHLVLVGDGSDRIRLERFSRIVQPPDRIHLVGRQDAVAPLLSSAEMVWVPSHGDVGVNVALEAMSLGRPVIAARQPGLADVVIDGETGLLIPPGGKAALARCTRRLLDEPSLRHRLGETGRQRVARLFSAEALSRRFVELYGGMTDERANYQWPLRRVG
jgi:glycosyltransferase involved in cell wall biosynthesis